ncbi:Copper radical oxidase [Glomus cerebriforme]|uniref:Copper radical oxidase n=1 Tax=Glomus cerebriforme TaxID=658196 RepID=A0A397SM45_9GLOM|nr:Copper radical oxidase [Glomus cerebriforme]
MRIIKFISILALGIGLIGLVSASPLRPRQAQQAPLGKWDIVGDSQVAAMHIVLASYKDIYIIDKLEVNKIKQANGNPAISAIYDIETNQVTPLDLTTDTFCSAGSFFGNGTLFHGGGAENGLGYNPGYQTARFITPTDPNPNWIELPDGLVTDRWYPAMATLPSGDVLIMGGALKGTGKNNANFNNPTYEIWSAGGPPQPQPVQFPFLVDTMPFNLYPFVHVMPNFENKQLIFVFANTQGVLFDLGTNTAVSKTPVLPGGVRSYPLSGNSILLPLKPSLNYKPTVMICGGNTVMEITSPAIASCGRIDPTDPNAQWEMDNFGGTGRVMPDSVLLPDAKVLYVNGAGTGFAGFHRGTKDNPLYLNDNPTLTPFIYDPETKEWNTNLVPSTVPRLYHSVATLVSDGRVFVTGSNPQPNVEVGTKFPTEYRVEMFTPPYLQTGLARPIINSVAGFTTLNTQRIDVTYQQSVEVKITKGQTNSFITAAIIHHGFVTHSQSFSRKYVMLNVKSAQFDPNDNNNLTLNLEMPPNPSILPPGPSYLYILDNGVPATYSVALTLGLTTTTT